MEPQVPEKSPCLLPYHPPEGHVPADKPSSAVFLQPADHSVLLKFPVRCFPALISQSEPVSDKIQKIRVSLFPDHSLLLPSHASFLRAVWQLTDPGQSPLPPYPRKTRHIPQIPVQVFPLSFPHRYLPHSRQTIPVLLPFYSEATAWSFPVP